MNSSLTGRIRSVHDPFLVLVALRSMPSGFHVFSTLRNYDFEGRAPRSRPRPKRTLSSSSRDRKAGPKCRTHSCLALLTIMAITSSHSAPSPSGSQSRYHSSEITLAYEIMSQRTQVELMRSTWAGRRTWSGDIPRICGGRSFVRGWSSCRCRDQGCRCWQGWRPQGHFCTRYGIACTADPLR